MWKDSFFRTCPINNIIILKIIINDITYYIIFLSDNENSLGPRATDIPLIDARRWDFTDHMILFSNNYNGRNTLTNHTATLGSHGCQGWLQISSDWPRIGQIRDFFGSDWHQNRLISDRKNLGFIQTDQLSSQPLHPRGESIISTYIKANCEINWPPWYYIWADRESMNGV